MKAKYSFDGRGINDATDPYRERIATFRTGLDSAKIRQHGALMAAAPEMLAALEDAEFLLRKAGQVAGPMQDSFKRSAADARAAIAKAKGE